MAPKPATTPCIDCPLRRLSVFRKFTPEELKFVESLKSGELVADPGTPILAEGQNSPHLYTVLSGWAFRYKTLPDGRRQVLNFALPGDFLGLQSAIFKEMDHSVEALTRITLCIFPRQKLRSIFEGHADLAFDLTWIASREERLLDEQLLSVGRRSAIERLAYLFVHIVNRATGLNLVCPKRGVHLPFTQQHLADTLGLSLVHTNKTIRRLSDHGLLAWKNGYFKVLDEDALRRIAGYATNEQGQRPFI